MRDEALARELAGLNEQLAEGELARREYEFLRERLAARAAGLESAGTEGAIRSRRSLRAWRWPVAGLLAAALIVATLVPALRQRGPGDFSSGNDFASAPAPPPGVAEWRAAEAAMAAGEAGRAVASYRAALPFFPDRADLRARFGFALALAGRPTQAVEQLRRAVRAAPTLPSARLYLGAVLLREGKREEAAAHWRRYLELEPKGEAATLVRRALAGRPITLPEEE